MPKRVLVIGGAGFIGSHLTEALLARRALPTVIDNLSSGRLENLDLADPRLAFVNLDVGESHQGIAGSALDRLIAEADFVYHLASPIGVARAHREPFDTTRRILEDGLNVIAGCLRHRRPVLYASSSEIYGVGGDHALGEDETAGFGLQPRWGYGAAKMAMEHLVAGLWREHGVPAWSVRFFNVVGPRQNPESGLVVAAFCKAVLDGKDIVVHGDGNDRRTFMHVLDSVSALVAIAGSRDLRGKSINVGGLENISVRELAELVVKLRGGGRIVCKSYEEVYGIGFVPVKDRRPKLDLLQSATGWEPRHTLEEAIAGCFATMERWRLEQGR
ncbi:MAG: NAD-dependent epimerase/dehydratase family protein [Burkholderiales bacterium]|nr:NAD-dependent epimerase/dehydratase family protein [Burkholderiales bacterium]